MFFNEADLVCKDVLYQDGYAPTVGIFHSPAAREGQRLHTLLHKYEVVLPGMRLGRASPQRKGVHLTRTNCGREEASEGQAAPEAGKESKQAGADEEKSALEELEEVLGPEVESLEDTPEERDAAGPDTASQVVGPTCIVLVIASIWQI